MVQKSVFTLVDCLEEAMDLWHFGKNWFELPTHNLYIPVKTTLMMKPKLTQGEDEFGWRLIDRHDKKTTTPRIHPTQPLNPLKGVSLAPNMHKEQKAVKISPVYEKGKYDVTPTQFAKNRRLSNIHPRPPVRRRG